MNDETLIKKYVPEDKRKDALKKLSEGYPVQYIIGNVEFYGLKIFVNEDVLIPRFETEYLVDYLIKYLKEYNFSNPNILEIGTGSGCISLALKNNISSNITSIDISKKAIDVAKNNAKYNNLDVNFQNISIEDYNESVKYDVIISNPPYVDKDEYVDEKTKYEPQDAIFAPDNGLYFYKLILKKAKIMLKSKSIIAFEIGSNQEKTLRPIVNTYFPNSTIIFKNDLNGLNRYLFIINE